MKPRAVYSLTLAMLVAVGGCSTNGPMAGAVLGPTPASTASAWTLAQAQVGQDVRASRYAAAERVLADFQLSHPTAPEMAEALYYRALYKLDPANTAAAPHEAVILLDSLLASPIVSPHLADAYVLRRVAAAFAAQASAPPTVMVKEQAPGKPDEARGKDEEIVKLREELAKASAELERVKRRVATPKP